MLANGNDDVIIPASFASYHNVGNLPRNQVLVVELLFLNQRLISSLISVMGRSFRVMSIFREAVNAQIESELFFSKIRLQT